MFNGDDDQQLDVPLPDPFLDADDHPVEPDWARLACWDDLRAGPTSVPIPPTGSGSPSDTPTQAVPTPIMASRVTSSASSSSDIDSVPAGRAGSTR